MSMPRQLPRCEKCGQALRRSAEVLPLAKRTSLCYVGRNLYAIAGHPGLWWLASAGDTTERVMATRGPGKNRGGAASFYRAEEVENIIHAALSKPEENQ